MVHRVYPLFLPFCKLYGFIYIMPVFSRRAALLIIGKTVPVSYTHLTKIKPIKSTLSKALDYIQNPDKTDGKMLVSSFG